MEIYGHEYAISFPRHAWPAGRDRKLSPIHDRIAALGAQFNAYNGWERATWYAQAGRRRLGGADADVPPRRTVAAAHPRGVPGRARRRRHPRPARLLALPPARRRRARLAVIADHRPRAETRPHRPRLFRRRAGPHRHRNVDHGAGRGFLLPDHRGSRRVARLRVAAEASAATHSDDSAKRHRRFHLPDPVRPERAKNPGRGDRRRSLAAVAVASVLPDRRALAAAGPRLLRRRARLGAPHQGRGHRCCVRRGVGGRAEARAKTVRHVRAGFARLEKGYRAWKQDLSTDYTILQGGLERFVKWDKPDFQRQGARCRTKSSRA